MLFTNLQISCAPWLALLVAAGCGDPTSIPQETAAQVAALEVGADTDSISLPADLQGTVIHFLRRLRRPNEPTIDRRLSVALQTPAPIRARLLSLSLVAPDGKRILDFAAGIGHWGDDDGNFTDRYFFRDVNEGEVGDGAYALQIELSDEGRHGGSFGVERAWSTADVQITKPGNIPFGAPISLNSARPLLEFKDFISPQFRSPEIRELELYVTHVLSSGDWVEQFRQRPPIGTTRARPTRDLQRGEHRLAVIFRERRDSGPLLLKRESETLIRFFSN